MSVLATASTPFPVVDYAPLALRFGAKDPAGIIIGAPLQYFYDVMKVAVSFHAAATRSFDNNNDGHPDETDTYDYDASIGMRAHLHEDSDGDGVVDENETYTYDSSLRLLTDASVSPLGVGSDFTVTNAYSPQGDLARAPSALSTPAERSPRTTLRRGTYGTAGNITDLGVEQHCERRQ